MRPKSNLNNMCGCGFRSIWDLYCPQHRHASLCACVRVSGEGDGGIDCAGPQTMWVYPRGWWEVSSSEHRGSCCPASQYRRHSLLSEIKVIAGPDELAEQTLAPSRAHTHVSTWQRAEIERGESTPGVTNGIAVCLQALQLYDLVTKWHMIVLHAV